MIQGSEGVFYCIFLDESWMKTGHAHNLKERLRREREVERIGEIEISWSKVSKEERLRRPEMMSKEYRTGCEEMEAWTKKGR